RQGVLIPKDNIRNLVLREDVVQAVRDGLFAIYGVESVDQGMEVLTGIPFGEPDEKGNYPEGTLNHALTKNLELLAAKSREVGARGDGERDEMGETPSQGPA
ncbi:MAG: ATP-dependent protease, partial [Chloroflexi bacterium]|nr:ATP-dependent protease [Chloroflexota bacterium]